jgi:hypothetical protein
MLRAYVAASKRKDRTAAAKIESAKLGSKTHHDMNGKYLYLTEAIILNRDAQYEELEELEQLHDANLILPDGVSWVSVLEELRADAEDEGPGWAGEPLFQGASLRGMFPVQSEPFQNYHYFSPTSVPPNGSSSTVAPMDLSFQDPSPSTVALDDVYPHTANGAIPAATMTYNGDYTQHHIDGHESEPENAFGGPGEGQLAAMEEDLEKWTDETHDNHDYGDDDDFF